MERVLTTSQIPSSDIFVHRSIPLSFDTCIFCIWGPIRWRRVHRSCEAQAPTEMPTFPRPRGNIHPSPTPLAGSTCEVVAITKIRLTHYSTLSQLFKMANGYVGLLPQRVRVHDWHHPQLEPPRQHHLHRRLLRGSMVC